MSFQCFPYSKITCKVVDTLRFHMLRFHINPHHISTRQLILLQLCSGSCCCCCRYQRMQSWNTQLLSTLYQYWSRVQMLVRWGIRTRWWWSLLQRFAFTNCKTVVCSISFVSNVVGWSNMDFFWHHAIVFASFYGVATQIFYFRDGLFAWLQICNEKMNSSVSVLVNVAVDFISMKACIVYDVNLHFAVTCKDNPCGEHESCTGPNLCTCDDGFRSIDGNCTSEEVFN